jgi:CheY-like chemotaxis protein
LGTPTERFLTPSTILATTALFFALGGAAYATNRYVITDIRMPGMDDHGVVAAIRDQPGLEHTRILAITASTDSGEPERLAAAGFDGYIEKPIDPATFIELVERFLPKQPRPRDPTADQP